MTGVTGLTGVTDVIGLEDVIGVKGVMRVEIGDRSVGVERTDEGGGKKGDQMLQRRTRKDRATQTIYAGILR